MIFKNKTQSVDSKFKVHTSDAFESFADRI